MKIGFSLSRCVKDIVRGDVKISEVLLIVSKTSVRFDEDHDGKIWEGLWLGYKHGGWSDPEWAQLDEAPTKQVVMQLWGDGRIHQPRLYGVHSPYRGGGYHWAETFTPPIPHYENVAVKQAWDHYQMLLNLSVKETNYDPADYDF